VVDYIVSKIKSESAINIYPYGSMSIGCKGEKITELGNMAIAGIKGISDGDVSIMDSALMYNIMRYSLMLDLPVITHCEDRSLSAGGVMNYGRASVEMGLKGIPHEAEEIIVARNIALAEGSGAKLHLTNISTKGSVALIRDAKARGAKITADTSPHYFMLTEDAALGYNTYAKVNPPLRTSEDVLALLEGIADGTLDIIASGHFPARPELKKMGFDSASWGISSLETTIPVCIERLCHDGILTPLELAAKLSENPAAVLGLKTKGRIAEGMDADFTVIDMNRGEEVDSSRFLSKSRFSPFDGMYLRGIILNTVVGGKIVYNRCNGV
ncbi:MAG: dihydroorotase, partial [Firmicutes bacterium]|nr:dihydroorotase [Bacillota bacterium]